MRIFVLPCVAILILSPAVRASVDETLDTLHNSGVTLASLAADVTMQTVDDLGNNKTRTGRFVLQKLPDGDTRVRATFDKTQSGTRIVHDKQDYLLAGTDLTDRDYAAKKQTVRQIRKPGQKVDLFKLGEGPFPLPVGQSRADVLKEFDVEELKNADPAVMAVVKLLPKAKTPLADKFKSIEVKVDQATKLPSVITTTSPNETDTNTVTLTNVRVNDAVSDKEFELEKIDPAEWNLVGTK